MRPISWKGARTKNRQHGTHASLFATHPCSAPLVPLRYLPTARHLQHAAPLHAPSVRIGQRGCTDHLQRKGTRKTPTMVSAAEAVKLVKSGERIWLHPYDVAPLMRPSRLQCRCYSAQAYRRFDGSLQGTFALDLLKTNLSSDRNSKTSNSSRSIPRAAPSGLRHPTTRPSLATTLSVAVTFARRCRCEPRELRV